MCGALVVRLDHIPRGFLDTHLINHFLSLIPYEPVEQEKVKLPPRQKRKYNRPPKSSQRMVPVKFAVK